MGKFVKHVGGTEAVIILLSKNLKDCLSITKYVTLKSYNTVMGMMVLKG